jgi:hypothetical protein
MKFKAYATLKSFNQAIQRAAEADLPATEDSDASLSNEKNAAKQKH